MKIYSSYILDSNPHLHGLLFYSNSYNKLILKTNIDIKYREISSEKLYTYLNYYIHIIIKNVGTQSHWTHSFAQLMHTFRLHSRQIASEHFMHL